MCSCPQVPSPVLGARPEEDQLVLSAVTTSSLWSNLKHSYADKWNIPLCSVGRKKKQVHKPMSAGLRNEKDGETF